MVFLCRFSTTNQSLIILCILITHKQEKLLKYFCTSEKNHEKLLNYVFFYLIKGKNSQFFAVKTKLFLFFPFSEAGHVLKMFLFLEKFEPQCSYKQGSYIKKACTSEGSHFLWDSF